MSAVGKPCFKCGHAITDEDIDKIIDWGQTTKSDYGIMVHTHLGFPTLEDDPDQEAVVCWSCHHLAQLQIALEYAHNLEYPYIIIDSKAVLKIAKTMSSYEVEEACQFYRKYNSPEEAEERVRLKRNDRKLKAVKTAIQAKIDSNIMVDAYDLNEILKILEGKTKVV